MYPPQQLVFLQFAIMHIIISFHQLNSLQQHLGSPLIEGADTIVGRVPDANDGAPAQAAVSPPMRVGLPSARQYAEPVRTTLPYTT